MLSFQLVLLSLICSAVQIQSLPIVIPPTVVPASIVAVTVPIISTSDPSLNLAAIQLAASNLQLASGKHQSTFVDDSAALSNPSIKTTVSTLASSVIVPLALNPLGLAQSANRIAAPRVRIGSGSSRPSGKKFDASKVPTGPIHVLRPKTIPARASR